MSVQMTKASDITTPMVSAEFVNLEETKPVFGIIADLNNANKICDFLLRVAFQNCKLKYLPFFTE